MNGMTMLNNTNKAGNASAPIPWDFNEKIMIILFYSTSILLSSVGNTIAILVFWVGSQRPNRSHEVRQFLMNLAISDLLISLFCLPFTFSYILLWDWPFPYVLCPIVLYIQTLAVTASSVTNMVIGFDRFWVVIYPMKSRITRRKSGLVIWCIWISSILSSSVQFFVSRAHIDEKGYTECKENWNNAALGFSYTVSILLITYILPLSSLTVTYSIVGIKLWNRSLPGEANEMRDAKHMKSKIKVIKMLSIIVVCFGVCWMPLHLFFVESHITQFQGYTKLRNIIYVICHWTAMSNTFVNPVVYGFMNDSFKSDFRWLVYQKCCILCYEHFWCQNSNFTSMSTRNSFVSNNLSATLTIHNKKHNQKLQFKDNYSPEKSDEVEILFQKNNQEKMKILADNSQLTKTSAMNNKKSKNLVVKDPYEINRVNTEKYYQIITQL